MPSDGAHARCGFKRRPKRGSWPPVKDHIDSRQDQCNMPVCSIAIGRPCSGRRPCRPSNDLPITGGDAAESAPRFHTMSISLAGNEVIQVRHHHLSAPANRWPIDGPLSNLKRTWLSKLHRGTSCRANDCAFGGGAQAPSVQRRRPSRLVDSGTAGAARRPPFIS